MMELEIEKAPDHVEPAPATSSIYAQPPAYFDEALKDAERLLKYAAESGIAVDESTRDHILQARAASETGWT